MMPRQCLTALTLVMAVLATDRRFGFVVGKIAADDYFSHHQVMHTASSLSP